MPTDFRTSEVTLLAGVSPSLVFMSRPARRTLIIASATSGTTFVGISGSNFSSKVFARVPQGDTLIMPYRDYGSLITGEIWIAGTVAGITANGAEVFSV